MYLKQSTAATVKLGPFVDSTDGNTAETGLTISQADVRLSKNGGDLAQKNDATACTHDELGVYDCPLNTTDTNTLGRLQLYVHEAGALPVWATYMVIPANVYDSLFGSDKLQTHLVEIDIDPLDDIADAVWDEALGPHLITGTVADALADAAGAGSGSDPWETTLPGDYDPNTAGWILGTRLDAQVSSISGNNPGAGANEWTYTLTDALTANPIPDADVWVSTDAGGSSVVASGRTDQNGQITFYLDSGTVYIWRQKSGWNFTNPDTEVVP